MTQSPPPAFDRHMIEALVCPVTHATLFYDAASQELVSRAAGLAFPIRAGIPIMLVAEARQIKAD
ncbi:Trm112 family protein [uncultured Paracoccus sp.]|uniref:Trm112 family protein n=1 Tax=uncultured Paracoccus sp. TaxID=189685 RepID=UPI0025E2A4FF|nr:Trm112 family protein [uncultured Paracoccus sp.]